MNTSKNVRRAALAAALALTLGLGIAASTPVVYANCGTQSHGPGCKQAEPPPSSDPDATEENLLERFIKLAAGFFSIPV